MEEQNQHNGKTSDELAVVKGESKSLDDDIKQLEEEINGIDRKISNIDDELDKHTINKEFII